MSDKICYSAGELQRLLGLGRNTIYQLIQRSDFPSLRIGRRVLIPADALEKWLVAHAQGGENEVGIR